MEKLTRSKLYKKIMDVRVTDHASMHLKLNGFIPKGIVLIPGTNEFNYYDNPTVKTLAHEICKWSNVRTIECEKFTVNNVPGYKMILHPHELSTVEGNPADALAWMWIELVKDGALFQNWVPDRFKDDQTLNRMIFPELY